MCQINVHCDCCHEEQQAAVVEKLGEIVDALDRINATLKQLSPANGTPVLVLTIGPITEQQ